jgi:hypothetical protein
MGKLEPIFWIVGSGVGFFVFLLLLESIKGIKKKKR